MFLLANKWRINRLRKLLYPGLEISPSIIQEFVNYSPLHCQCPTTQTPCARAHTHTTGGIWTGERPADKLGMIKIICFRKIIWKQTLPWQEDLHIWLVITFNIPGARVLRLDWKLGDLDEVNEGLWGNNDFRFVCLSDCAFNWCLQHRGI